MAVTTQKNTIDTKLVGPGMLSCVKIYEHLRMKKRLALLCSKTVRPHINAASRNVLLLL
jgi:hypothetical protein